MIEEQEDIPSNKQILILEGVPLEDSQLLSDYTRNETTLHVLTCPDPEATALFSRQLQANGQAGDVFFGISTSGNSGNVVAAVEVAKKMEIHTVALCGQSGKLPTMCDFTLMSPSTSTPTIQECHIVIGHIVCGIVEEVLFGDKK